MTIPIALALVASASVPLLVRQAVMARRRVVRDLARNQRRARSRRRAVGRLEVVGRQIRQLIGYPHHDAHDRTIGRVVVIVPVCAIAQPLLAVLVMVVLCGSHVLRLRRLSRMRERQLLRELPEIVDLYAVALHSGHNVATATREVAKRGEGLVATALDAVVDQVERGRALDVALEGLVAATGAHVRPVTSVLVSGVRYGAPIAESLVRVAGDLRLERRRHAERAARRLPVVMLFPLVLCVLPAFGLLTVVPVLVESLQSLTLS